ncbi:MAG: CDP-diacylglycerol--glycerol-3-phosphate 3-phosphatidyltransferase [Lachnospiraceae bacterium]|jgi:CDP-diacylglycerol--glycerol-3-phosphate 3-phosphatidyltransferase
MNLPNKLTLIRIVAIIPFTIFMLVNGCEGFFKWASLVVFVAASLTDTLDGYIARRDKLVTDFGKFMDPLADKMIVCAAMICLVSIGRLPAWICIIIIARDFIISGFRLVAAESGKVIAANIWGKVKTTVQMIMIILLIIDFKVMFLHVITVICVYLALVLTVVSLVIYLYQNRSVLNFENL